MELINKAAVIDAIERLIDSTIMDEVDEDGIFHNEHARFVFNLLCDLEDVIYNLEVKEVNLERKNKNNMTDKERIVAEIKRLQNEWRYHASTEAKYRCEAYSELLEWIYSKLEEPAFGNPEEVAKHFSEHCINQTQKEKQ